MHLSVVLLVFSLVSVCSWAHRSYTDTRPYRRSSEDTCEPTQECEPKAGSRSTAETKVCPSTTCTYNRTKADLFVTNMGNYAKSSQIDVNAFGTSSHHVLNIVQADFSNITFTLDAKIKRKRSDLNMSSKNCSVSGFWQNSSNAKIKCSFSNLHLEGKANPSSVSLDVKDSTATVAVVNSTGKIEIQSSNLTLDIISSNNIILNIANCIIPERVSLSHLKNNITVHDQKECEQQLVHTFTTTTPPATTTQAAHSIQSLPFGYSLFVTLILYFLY